MSDLLARPAADTPGSTRPSYGDVPAADPAAVIDPHWVDLRGESTLPTTYLPPSMPGPRRLWQRVVAVGLAAMFFGCTAAGVCLTYGPPLHGLW